MTERIRVDYGSPGERVARGARWLDEVVPGWECRIDPDTLCMQTDYSCICGRVFSGEADDVGGGGYQYAMGLLKEANSWLSELAPPNAIDVKGQALAVALGFDGGFTVVLRTAHDVTYGELHDAWIRLLAERAARAAHDDR